MRRVLPAAVLAAMGLAVSTGLASAGVPASGDGIVSQTIVQQRKDVDEVSRPQPPSGPATPVPFCSPGSPICP